MNILRRIRYRSLGDKLFAAAIPLAILPLLIFALLAYNSERDTLTEEVDRQLELLTRDLSNRASATHSAALESLETELGVFRYIFEARGRAHIIDEQMHLLGSDEPHIVNGNFELVDQLRDMTGHRATIFQRVGDQAVRISTNVPKADGDRAVGTVVSQPVFDAVINRGETFVGVADVVGTLYLTAYEPIIDPRGETIGILFIGVQQDSLYRQFFEDVYNMTLWDSGHIYLLDTEGNPVKQGRRLATGTLPDDVIGQITTDDKNPTQIASKLESLNTSNVFWHSYVPGPGWHVVTLARAEEFLKPLTEVRLILGITLLGLVALILFFSVAAGNYLSKRTQRLIEVARRMSEGRMAEAQAIMEDVDGTDTNQDEFVLIGNAFNEAIENILARDSALAAHSERLDAILGAGREGMHILEMNGAVLECNKSFANMLGYTLEEARNLNIAEWDTELRPSELHALIEQMIESPGHHQTVYRRRDNTLVPVEVTAQAIVLSGKTYLYASARDISRRIAAQDEISTLRKRCDQLAIIRGRDESGGIEPDS